MKKEDIQTKIDVILDNLEKLNTLKVKRYEDFISDFRNIDSALHRLQTSIQALLDIGSYIIASLGLRTPNTNAEIIEILSDAGYISKERIETYIKMTQFRNRIVHLYNHIEKKTLYDILVNELADLKDFYANLLKIIDEHKG
ncbi:MAG: DUF86 domain-containing protein [Nitrospirota bacterium]